jgi:hypothetical protein
MLQQISVKIPETMKETKQVSSVEIFVQDWKALQPVQSLIKLGVRLISRPQDSLEASKSLQLLIISFLDE